MRTLQANGWYQISYKDAIESEPKRAILPPYLPAPCEKCGQKWTYQHICHINSNKGVK